jgi:hypothetical protein
MQQLLSTFLYRARILTAHIYQKRNFTVKGSDQIRTTLTQMEFAEDANDNFGFNISSSF